MALLHQTPSLFNSGFRTSYQIGDSRVSVIKDRLDSTSVPWRLRFDERGARSDARAWAQDRADAWELKFATRREALLYLEAISDGPLPLLARPLSLRDLQARPDGSHEYVLASGRLIRLEPEGEYWQIVSEPRIWSLHRVRTINQACRLLANLEAAEENSSDLIS